MKVLCRTLRHLNGSFGFKLAGTLVELTEFEFWDLSRKGFVEKIEIPKGVKVYQNTYETKVITPEVRETKQPEPIKEEVQEPEIGKQKYKTKSVKNSKNS